MVDKVDKPEAEEISAEEVQKIPPISDAPPPRKRGRPRKEESTKAKVKPEALPDEIVAIVAFAPILLASIAAKYATTEKDANGVVTFEGVSLRPSQEAIAACVPAFKVWLASLNIELTPGMALLGCYAIALGSAIPDAMAQLENKKNAPKPVEPLKSVTNEPENLERAGSSRSNSTPSL